MTHREVMQMALDCLLTLHKSNNRYISTVDALREALAQPEPKPFAVTTGYYSGRATIVPLNPAVVVPMNMALYLAPPAPEVPVGWKLVPIEPDENMIDQGAQGMAIFDDGVFWPKSFDPVQVRGMRLDAKKAWRYMVFAAPEYKEKP